MIKFCSVVFNWWWYFVSCVYTVNRFTSCKPFCQVVLLYSQTQCGPCVGVKSFYLTAIVPGVPGLSAAVALLPMLHFCALPHRGAWLWFFVVRRSAEMGIVTPSPTPLSHFTHPLFSEHFAPKWKRDELHPKPDFCATFDSQISYATLFCLWCNFQSLE